MDIIEFELKRFEFRANMFPVSEDRDIQILFRAIFGAEICSLFGENGKLKAETGEKQLTVRLDDAASRLIEIVPAVKTATFRKISRKKNREIADLTGKIRGFRQSLTDNRGDKAAALVDADPGYVYRVLPYAYCFAMTSKLSSNFNHISIEVPEWYFPYGVGEDYVMDVVIYSAMLRNLPEELKTLVFENIELLRKVNL